MGRKEYTNVNDFITAIVMNGGWNWVNLKFEFVKYQTDINPNITFPKWFKKHLKEMYDLSDYAIKKVMYAFKNEIKEAESMKLILA